ncbi:MAG: STAS domain-containing protein [Acidobacteria bacterium]|nr:STAS domain-containing protein [Acidobacteriota bacterium]
MTVQGRRAFVLNLAGVSSLDSHGLGDLVGAHQAAAAQGGVVKLANVHERVAHPLDIMNLSKILERFDSEDEALRSFES